MKLIPLGFLSVGVIILMQVILPIISFQIWWFGQKANNQILISPQKSTSNILGVSVKSEDNFPAFVSNATREIQAPYQEFNITVSRLNLQNKRVLVDSNELSKGLVHLPGSALPGTKGNVFISGHSAANPLLGLREAPFARLTDLKKGDQILVEAGGAKFVYQVVEFKVVDPSDLSVILPPDTMGRYISLMTCVPPGLNFKRLVVLGKML